MSGDAVTPQRPTSTSRISSTLGWILLAVPAGIALGGPLLAGPTGSDGPPLSPPGAVYPLGTDVLGRDVLALVLSGGFSVMSLTAQSLLLAYALGVPLGMLAATRRRIGALFVRLLDVVLALPGLLVLLVLAAGGRREMPILIGAVAVLQLPPVVRLVRGAALAPGCRTTVEAMTMQGEPWWRIHLDHVGRAVVGPVLVDAGGRISTILYLLASANFLGLGLDPASADWAVLVERNREALFLQPWAAVTPALLLVSLCTGANLVVDHVLARRTEGAPCRDRF